MESSQEAIDNLVKKRRKKPRLLKPVFEEYSSSFLPYNVDPVTYTSPAPWYDINFTPSKVNEKIELIKQRDDYMQNLIDLQTDYIAYQNNNLEDGHGKYLLKFPEILNTLSEIVEMRDNQIFAIENFKQSKFVNLFKIQRKLVQTNIINTSESEIPSINEAKKMNKTQLSQLLTDDLGVDHDKLDTELSTA